VFVLKINIETLIVNDKEMTIPKICLLLNLVYHHVETFDLA